jgi:hypothetical protein
MHSERQVLSKDWRDRNPSPTPRSKNPKFYKSWVGDVPVPDVEAVCAKWEGADVHEDERGN